MDRTTDYIGQLEIVKDTITKPENQRNTVRKILGEATMEGCDAAEIARAASRLFPWFDPLKVPAPGKSASTDVSASEYLEGDIYMKIASIPDEMERVEEKILHKAKAKKAGVGAREFDALYKAAEAKIKAERDASAGQSVLDVDGVPHRLPGRYARTDAGEIVEVETGAIVCPHDICVTARVKNLTSGEYSVQLAFKREYESEWSFAYIDKTEISQKQKITALSGLHDIAVTSETAGALVQYMMDDYETHRATLPQEKIIERLGWVDGEYIPYSDKIAFSGAPEYAKIASDVTQKGTYEAWEKAVKPLLYGDKSKVLHKVVMATGIASPLLDSLQTTGWITHLDTKTTAGKTVELVMAMSVWGDPRLGHLITDFSSTDNGLKERMGVLHSIPIAIDEYSLSRKAQNGGDASDLAYMVSSGQDKDRARAGGGLRDKKTWRLNALTTGERPLLLEDANGGAEARVLNLHIAESEGPLFADPVGLCEVLQANFGHAGRRWIEWIQANPDRITKALRSKKNRFAGFKTAGFQEKHSMIAAVLIVASELFSEAMGWEKSFLSCEEVKQFLLKKEAISKEEHDWKWLQGWIASRQSDLLTGDSEHDEKVKSAIGKIDDDFIYIINSELKKACQAAKIPQKATLRWGAETGKVMDSKTVKIGKTGAYCAVICADALGVDLVPTEVQEAIDRHERETDTFTEEPGERW